MLELTNRDANAVSRARFICYLLYTTFTYQLMGLTVAYFIGGINKEINFLIAF